MLKRAIHPITSNIWFRDATPKLLRNFRYLDTLEQYKEFAAEEKLEICSDFVQNIPQSTFFIERPRGLKNRQEGDFLVDKFINSSII
jgi:predicted nuclease of restriction endonuclease-like (RecB) superfamily